LSLSRDVRCFDGQASEYVLEDLEPDLCREGEQRRSQIVRVRAVMEFHEHKSIGETREKAQILTWLVVAPQAD